MSNPVSITVSTGVAISAKSTATTPGDHVAVFDLAGKGGTNNAALNVVSANPAFTACEVTGHETAHGTVKISHLNPGPFGTSDETPLPSVSTCKQEDQTVPRRRASSSSPPPVVRQARS
jgi:hypothetical protein